MNDDGTCHPLIKSPMPQHAFQYQPTKDADSRQSPVAGSFFHSRNLLCALVLCVLGLTVLIGVASFNTRALQNEVDRIFFNRLPASSQTLNTIQTRLETLSSLLPDYAQPRLLLAKLYLIRAKAGIDANSARPDFLSAARHQLEQVRMQQPTHYPAIGMTVWLESQSGLPLEERLPALRLALHNGALEKTNQWLLGPVVVADWHYLPDDLQALSGPMIKSMLSEQESRHRILDAMYTHQRFLPFTQFSPNRDTSYLLRTLHAIYVSPKSR
ncbi:hypothetical protein [Alteromonas antoniana]|uniref:hypothetical protein n=1 Tax=Alteromonas antoniana TaxID=2803813 RepID=UPI001C492324|nr:hypothetical protein [Alteromonas antoniana]